MTSANSAQTDDRFLANAMASFLQIGAVFLLALWCFRLVSPFVTIVVWGVIISVALYPAHQSLTAKLNGRSKTSSALLVLVGLAIVIVPTWLLAESSMDALHYVAAEFEDGQVSISPPDASVAEWPLIGERVYDFWAIAASSIEETANRYEEQLKNLGSMAVKLAGSTIGTVFQFVFSILIAGSLLNSAESGYRTTRSIAGSLMGDGTGDRMTDMSIMTIRSVVKGVLGVAIIQAFLAAIGLATIGVPAPGLWAAAVLVLAIVQLPPILILGPIAIWVFSVAEPVPATIFLVYSFIVSFSDAVLKPMLLGRGLETPMLVILIGAIGGAITSGVVGLFIGAVILSLGYNLLVAWMAPDKEVAAEASA